MSEHAAPTPDTPTSATMLLSGAGLIDGTGSGFLEGHALLVKHGRILEVGPMDGLLKKADKVLDFGSGVLLPGFVDAHTHITVRPGEGDQHGQLRRPAVWQALRGVANARAMLASGVTTARIMGERAGIDSAFKQAIEFDELAGPRLHIALEALSATHGHGAALGVADGIEGIRLKIRENIRNGADHIKLFVTGGVSSSGPDLNAYHYSREEIRAAVEETHRAGLRVAAHAHGGDGVTICAEEGVDSIEHGGLLSEANITAMVEHGSWLVLTNTIAFHPQGIEKGDAKRPEILAKLQQVRRTVEATFERIKTSGLRYALGTDSMHGLFGYELEWLVNHGVAAEQAIIAATRHGAEVIGQEHELGTLEPGKVADVLVLGSNPLANIRAVYKVLAVVKDGRLAIDHRDTD